MTLVRNSYPHPYTPSSTGRTLAPQEVADIDVSGAQEQDAIANHGLTVMDPAYVPPVTPLPPLLPYTPDDFPDVGLVGGAYDDATDSTAACQRALDTYGGFRLSGPVRVQQLAMPAGAVIDGSASGGYGIVIPNRRRHARITRVAGSNQHLILGAAGAAHVRLRRVHLDGNKAANTAGDLIHLDDVAGVGEEAQWLISDVFAEGSPGHGLYVGTGRRAVKVTDKSAFNYHGGCGVKFSGSDSAIIGCIVGSNVSDGVQCGGRVTRVENCDIYSNSNGVNVLSTVQQMRITGNGIDRNLLNGVLLSASSDLTIVAHNIFHSNSQTANGGAHHVNVQTTNPPIVDANEFGIDSGITNAAGYCCFLGGATVTVRGAIGAMSDTAAATLGLTNDFARVLR